MDQEQLKLVCAAFYEFLESGLFKLQKDGPALKAFKKMMASQATAPEAAATHTDLPAPAGHLIQSDKANESATPKKIPGLENKIKNAEQHKQEMNSRLNELLKQNQEMDHHVLKKIKN